MFFGSFDKTVQNANYSSVSKNKNSTDSSIRNNYTDNQSRIEDKSDFNNNSKSYNKYSFNNSKNKSGFSTLTSNARPYNFNFKQRTFPEYEKENSKNEYEPFFTIFGIDLYFDDILILALLLFLNTEDVKDSYLYIVLIMLLFN